MVNFKHGMARRKKCFPEYRIWNYIKSRCCNPKCSIYYKYGGRGIKICERWLNNFEYFYKDMGSKPTSKHQIDRIDNEGDYEPNNCHWVTASENASNRRTTRFLTFNGKTQTLKEWSLETKIPCSTIQNRLKAGLSVEETLTKEKYKWHRLQ